MSNLTPRVNRLENNLIIDGAMEIWPEGTSRSIANNAAAYGPVLFQYNNISSGITTTLARSSDVPTNSGLNFSTRVSKTAAGTLAAGTRSILHYHVEGYDLRPVINNQWTLIFWVKSSVAATRSVSVRNGTTTHSYVKQYTINQANTWELKAVSFPAMSTCPGALDRANGLGMVIGWDIVTGSTFTTSSVNQWVTGNFSSGPGGDTTWLTGTTHDFSIAGVMVLPGNWEGLNAAQYNFVRAGRNFEDEVAMSQRYYEKSYDTDIAPGALSDNGFICNIRASGAAGGSITFKSTKRAIPIVTAYSHVTGASGQIRDINVSVDRAATISNIGVNGIGIIGSAATPTSSAQALHFTADSRF
jgi:hypothetical protein